MTVERTVCRYVVVIGTGEFCGNPTLIYNGACDKIECPYYTPLMYKPEEATHE